MEIAGVKLISKKSLNQTIQFAMDYRDRLHRHQVHAKNEKERHYFTSANPLCMRGDY